MPHEIESNDELYITGLHLEQYRHATRYPEPYWREALRRDPGDARCNNALGAWHLRRGEFAAAETHFRKAIERLTRRNPNPYDGEPYYNLGVTLRYLNKDEDAYTAFYKATWNQSWQAAGYHALAELDCRKSQWSVALDHLDRALRLITDNLKARDLRAIVLRKLNRSEEAEAQLRATLTLDPLDWWARHLLGEELQYDTQVRLDLALDFARAGFYHEAIRLLLKATPEVGSGTLPLIRYYLGWLYQQVNDIDSAQKYFVEASNATPDYCFPARLEEIVILQDAIQFNRHDAKALYYLGNLFYDRRRHEEAIELWEKSAQLDGNFSIVWRNLGIGYFNIRRQNDQARAAYNKAFESNLGDARLLYERDQLWKRLGVAPEVRLAELQKHPELVQERDDLSLELSALYNQAGQHEKALALITMRHFQPWEGGEGLALGQHVRTHLALGRRALNAGDATAAHWHFKCALTSPQNLGEAKHLLANQSDIHYWLGIACDTLGDTNGARDHWTAAATFRGDFQQMDVRPFSEMTYFTALALQRLGQQEEAHQMLMNLRDYAQMLFTAETKIDYFATSLPSMLLFDEDLQQRQTITATFLLAQAELGLGQKTVAQRLLEQVLEMDSNHALAADFLANAL